VLDLGEGAAANLNERGLELEQVLAQGEVVEHLLLERGQRQNAGNQRPVGNRWGGGRRSTSALQNVVHALDGLGSPPDVSA
jgi:hypothetical protein